MHSDAWVLSLGLVILPLFGLALWHAPDASAAELALNAWGIGSLRANWAIYCSHALSHGRWTSLVGRSGSRKFQAALAVANAGTVFQIIPGYWLMHQTHHTRLGALPLDEARSRARAARPTDGDLGIATRVFSPPARKYRLVLQRDGSAVLPRQPELTHQGLNLLVHAIAPVGLCGYVVAALRADQADQAQYAASAGAPAAGPAASAGTAGAVSTDAGATGTGSSKRRAMIDGLALQAACTASAYAAVAAYSAYSGSLAPLGLYVGSSALWLSPLNPNWVWTCPHLCDPAEREAQPTVSFYTPPNPIGAALDAYMGWENYHVEHHDFPEIPMYALPALRRVAPEFYDSLRTMPLLETSTLRELWGGDFFYACQHDTFGVRAAADGGDGGAQSGEEQLTALVE